MEKVGWDWYTEIQMLNRENKAKDMSELHDETTP